MKKKFLFLFFLLYTFVSVSQTIFNFSPYDYTIFKSSGNAQCGVGNTYCTIYRSNTPNNFNNYVYSVYLASNSYLIDCSPSKTYVSSVEIYYFDKTVNKYITPRNFYPFWVIIGETTVVYTFFHPNPNLIFHIKLGNMEPTIY
jgi:hypothetical protein